MRRRAKVISISQPSRAPSRATFRPPPDNSSWSLESKSGAKFHIVENPRSICRFNFSELWQGLRDAGLVYDVPLNHFGTQIENLLEKHLRDVFESQAENSDFAGKLQETIDAHEVTIEDRDEKIAELEITLQTNRDGWKDAEQRAETLNNELIELQARMRGLGK